MHICDCITLYSLLRCLLEAGSPAWLAPSTAAAQSALSHATCLYFEQGCSAVRHNRPCLFDSRLQQETTGGRSERASASVMPAADSE